MKARILVIDPVDKAKRVSRSFFSDVSMVSMVIKDKTKYNRKEKFKRIDY